MNFIIEIHSINILFDLHLDESNKDTPRECLTNKKMLKRFSDFLTACVLGKDIDDDYVKELMENEFLKTITLEFIESQIPKNIMRDNLIEITVLNMNGDVILKTI